MSVALVTETGEWERGTPFALRVMNFDGEYSTMLRPDGGCDIQLEQEHADRDRWLIISVSFPTKTQAERAGTVLDEAFRKVRAISDEETPDPATCTHDSPIIARLQRSEPPMEFCPDCGHEPVERDWDAWIAYMDSKK